MKSTIKNVFAIIIASLLLASCSTISYSPKVSLDVASATIPKSVQIDKFVDVSPEIDKKNPFMGLSITNKESLPNGLDLEVTNSIVSDFSNNSLFKQVSRRVENPDFIIKGEIKKFTGKSEMNAFAKTSYFIGLACVIVGPGYPPAYIGAIPLLSWYFGIPISKNTSLVEITMNVYDKNNTLIGTYKGLASDIISSNMYTNKSMAVPSMTNKTYSKAISQIRDQMIADMAKFTGN